MKLAKTNAKISLEGGESDHYVLIRKQKMLDDEGQNSRVKNNSSLVCYTKSSISPLLLVHCY